MNKVFVLLIFYICCSLNLRSQITVDSMLSAADAELAIGNYQKGLKDMLKALSVAEKRNNKKELASANLMVSRAMYLNRQPFREILKYCFHSRKYMLESGFLDSYGTVSTNIGVLYVEQGILDSALIYLNDAKSFFEKTQNNEEVSKVYAILFELRTQQGNKKEALEAIMQAEKFAQLGKSPLAYARALIKHGIYYLNHKDYANAIPYLNKVKAIHDSLKNIEGQLYVNPLLAGARLGLSDTVWLNEFNAFMRLKDSVFRAGADKEIAKFKVSFETEKKERENKILQQENQLKQARISRIINWVILLVVVLLGLVMFVLWRINSINLKRKQEELRYSLKIQHERERVSRDLHDNAGSLISFVSNKIDWMLKNKSFDKSTYEDLNSIKANSRQIMEGLRETLWTLNASSITTIDLVDKLKPYIKTHLLIPYKISDEVNKESVLDPEQVLNVYRSSQEIINNINKHSQATNVSIKFYDSNNKLVLEYYDNGVGIKLEDLEKENHYGMRNLKARLNEVKVDFAVETPIEGGTRIKLTLN